MSLSLGPAAAGGDFCGLVSLAIERKRRLQPLRYWRANRQRLEPSLTLIVENRLAPMLHLRLVGYAPERTRDVGTRVRVGAIADCRRYIDLGMSRQDSCA